MVNDVAWVSLAPTVAAVGACELCTTAEAGLAHAVLVQLERGGAAQLACCDPCAPAATRPPAGARRAAPATLPAAPPEVIRELADRLRDGAGTEYVVQVCGRE